MDLPQLFVLGDSISMDYGPHLQAYLSGICTYARKTGSERGLKEAGIEQEPNGRDSSAVLEYLRAVTARGDFHPDVLLLNCGLHDIKTDPGSGRRHVSLKKYGKNLETIADLLAEHHIHTIWVNTTPVNDEAHNTKKMDFHRFDRDVRRYNRCAEEVMAEAGVTVLDLNTFTANLKGKIYRDHVHFTAAVCAKQGAFIAGFVARDLEEAF